MDEKKLEELAEYYDTRDISAEIATADLKKWEEPTEPDADKLDQ
ncbi:hypothetical protein [Nocardiopsis nanhaiensis]